MADTGEDAFQAIATSQVAIPRLRGVTKAEFYAHHAHAPAIIERAFDDWPSRNWSFSSLCDAMGDEEVIITGSLNSRAYKACRFKDFADYVCGESPGPDNAPGDYVDRDRNILHGPPEPVKTPFYMMGSNPFRSNPALAGGVGVPDFCDDWFEKHLPTLDELFASRAVEQYHRWLLVGPPGSITELHTDHHAVNTLLCLVAGRKTVVLFAPETATVLLDDNGIGGNPFDAEFCEDLDEPLPMAHTGVLQPGDTLWIPSDWLHFVRGEAPHITVVRDCVDHLNADQYFSQMFLRDIPRLTRVVENLSPDERAALGITWRSLGFDLA